MGSGRVKRFSKSRGSGRAGARIVHRELERMEKGEIEELSEQHNAMLHQLASLSISSSSASVSESNPSNPVPTVQPAMSYAGVLSAPTAVSFAPNDVHRLPRLTGSVDVDIAEVLSQFRLVVGFRARVVALHDEKNCGQSYIRANVSHLRWSLYYVVPTTHVW